MLAHLHVGETHPERVRARVASEEEHELGFLQVARGQTLLDDIKEGTARCREWIYSQMTSHNPGRFLKAAVTGMIFSLVPLKPSMNDWGLFDITLEVNSRTLTKVSSFPPVQRSGDHILEGYIPHVQAGLHLDQREAQASERWPHHRQASGQSGVDL